MGHWCSAEPRPFFINEREYNPDDEYLRVRAALARLNRWRELKYVCSIQRLSDDEIKEMAGWLDGDTNRVHEDHKADFKRKAKEYADRSAAHHREWMVWAVGEWNTQLLEAEVPEDIVPLGILGDRSNDDPDAPQPDTRAATRSQRTLAPAPAHAASQEGKDTPRGTTKAPGRIDVRPPWRVPLLEVAPQPC
ncbi:unnamed protein product [Vitrella brassicaformis CCMP3155]|uniref:Uncharacterized protein n=1 Tax=Vitrella brassicaformis (strain CCMP3155) TaxID=1169540 RepID=A0A0G4EJW3_VITBC|nr:unnamed protein product [Vitrella brassicaformis CCMP3155]|eukprot:CEL97042.1 unnamed protein product [Vitrella brassicaformis CCMP3155]